jgi:hypothetical protein
MKTQRAYIEGQLRRYGAVRRNTCLRRFISRLAMHIDVLKKHGWQIEGRTVRTRSGKDYEYTLITCPTTPNTTHSS